MANKVEQVTRYFAVGVVMIFALIMGYILYELSGTKRYFGRQLVEQSSQRIQSELDEFFKPIENIMLTVKKQQELNLLENFDVVSLNRFLIPIIDRYPQVSSIALADSRGYEFNVLPADSTGNYWLNREVYVDKWGMKEKWQQWNFKDSPNRVRLWEEPLQTDPRNRAWFQNALKEKSRQIYWTEPYAYMTGQLGLTASVAWNSSVDTLQHILAFDVTLDDLTKLSQTLSVTDNDKIFILTKTNKEIVGFPKEYKESDSSMISNIYLSKPQEIGNPALTKLLDHPNDTIVSFSSVGQNWWGITKTYSINSSQELLIAVLVPEQDYAYEINSTRNVMIFGFLLILLLSSILMLNHNKLIKLGVELNRKNDQINQQKDRLFAEVHHRVKNNLAVMAALLELEQMENENREVQQVLIQSHRRIKSMATIQEVMYKSDELNRVFVADFVPGILNLSKSDFTKFGTTINHSIDSVQININQALTYSLLLNECMNCISKSRMEEDKELSFTIKQTEGHLITEIGTDSKVDFFETSAGIGKQLITVLLSQLGAKIEKLREDEDITYIISFVLKDKKGIASNFNY